MTDKILVEIEGVEINARDVEEALKKYFPYMTTVVKELRGQIFVCPDCGYKVQATEILEEP